MLFDSVDEIRNSTTHKSELFIVVHVYFGMCILSCTFTMFCTHYVIYKFTLYFSFVLIVLTVEDKALKMNGNV